jgi:prophage regulatory protein
MTAAPRFLMSLHTVCEAVDLSPATWQRMVRKGEAPQPRLASKARVAWLAREVEAWAEARPVSDLPPPPNTGSRKGKGRAEGEPS